MMLVYHVVTLSVLLSLIHRDEARAAGGPVAKKTDSTAMDWLARLLALKDDKDDFLEGMKDLLDAAGFNVKRRPPVSRSLLYCTPGLFPRAECTLSGRVRINCGVYGEDVDEGNGLTCRRVGDSICKRNQTCCHLKEEDTNRCIDLSKPYYKCSSFVGFPNCDIKCNGDDSSSDTTEETTEKPEPEKTTKSPDKSCDTEDGEECKESTCDEDDKDCKRESKESTCDEDDEDCKKGSKESSCDEDDSSEQCKPTEPKEETYECHYECNIPVTCKEKPKRPIVPKEQTGLTHVRAKPKQPKVPKQQTRRTHVRAIPKQLKVPKEQTRPTHVRAKTKIPEVPKVQMRSTHVRGVKESEGSKVSYESKETGEEDKEGSEDDESTEEEETKEEDNYKKENKVVHYSIFSNSLHHRRKRSQSEGENNNNNGEKKHEPEKKEHEPKEKEHEPEKEEDKDKHEDKKDEESDETAVAKIPKMSKGVLVDLSTCTLKCTTTDKKSLKCSSSSGKMTDVFGGKPAELDCKDGKCDLHTSANRPVTINVQNWYGNVYTGSSSGEDSSEESGEKEEETDEDNHEKKD